MLVLQKLVLLKFDFDFHELAYFPPQAQRTVDWIFSPRAAFFFVLPGIKLYLLPLYVAVPKTAPEAFRRAFVILQGTSAGKF